VSNPAGESNCFIDSSGRYDNNKTEMIHNRSNWIGGRAVGFIGPFKISRMTIRRLNGNAGGEAAYDYV